MLNAADEHIPATNVVGACPGAGRQIRITTAPRPSGGPGVAHHTKPPTSSGDSPPTNVTRFSSAHQLSFEDTMFRLIDGTTSLARGGDGELLSMLRPGYDLYFRRTTPELSAELRSVWTMQNLDADSLVLGFPDLSKGPYRSDVWANAWPACG